MKEIKQNDVSLGAVHTHTHTHTGDASGYLEYNKTRKNEDTSIFVFVLLMDVKHAQKIPVSFCVCFSPYKQKFKVVCLVWFWFNHFKLLLMRR